MLVGRGPSKASNGKAGTLCEPGWLCNKPPVLNYDAEPWDQKDRPGME